MDHSAAVIAAETEHRRDALLTAWNAQRPEAHANARTALDGPGRLGLKWAAVNRAKQALARWAVEWQPVIPTMPTGHAAIAGLAGTADDTPPHLRRPRGPCPPTGAGTSPRTRW